MAKKKTSKLSGMVDGPVNYIPTAEDKAREKRWRAEEDIRTIQRAEEIKKDKSRVAEMKKVANEQIKDLKKVC